MLHKKIHKHLKRKIHKNRWLVWAIVALVLAAAALVSYIEVSNIDFERVVLPYGNSVSWQTYRDNRMDFSLRFPPTWAIESDGGSVSFSNPKGEGDITVSVYDLNAESAIRKSLNIQDEDKVRVRGFAAVKIENMIADQAYETVVLVKANNKLYKISGSGEELNSIISTFNF